MFHLPSRISRYEIKTLIGAGGMGSLYLARDTNPNTNRLVALKLLHANLDSDDLRERFAREARALAALNHPNIVDIYDSGEFQGSPFIVMEYVRGETLGEKIKRRAPLTLAQKLKLMVELCSGLAHAHEAGIIHRDIKPANLMVDQHGRLKILDFGIARVSEGLTHAGLQVTQLNVRIGTPGYMSPEQIEGGEIDRRSDVFAVGAVLYELLSYREAFSGVNTRQIENKVLEASPQPLRTLIDGLDPEIEAIVARALAKNRDDRYQDAAAIEEALERQRWKLGPGDTPVPQPRHTPSPLFGLGRKTDSRADAAYNRSLALFNEGAHDAARRFAIEALAENPDHEDARAFIERLGPNRWSALPPRSNASMLTTSDDRTVLATGSRGTGTLAPAAPTVLSPASQRATSRSGIEKALLIAAIVVLVAATAGGAAFLIMHLTRPGPTLTITRPENGTILSDGINCGTRGAECVTQLKKNAPVELVAEADEGFVFSGFIGDCAAGGRTIMSEARTCGARFTVVAPPTTVPTHTLTIVMPRNGTIVGEGITCGTLGSDCTFAHPQGKEVKLRALPDADHAFRGFTGGCARNGETVMSAPRRCSATFVREAKAAAAAPPATPTPAKPRDSTAAGGRAAAGPTSPTPDPIGAVSPGDPIDLPEPAAPAGKPEPPPRTPESIARDDITKLLEAYRSAYEAMDLKRMQQLYPRVPAQSMRYAFSQYKTLEYSFTGAPEFVALDPALGTATVKVAALLKPEYKGPKLGPQTLMNVFKLIRQNDVWTIVELAHPPK